MRSNRRSSSTSNSLSVGTAGLEATTSRSRARSSIVVPGEASATSDRSPAFWSVDGRPRKAFRRRLPDAHRRISGPMTLAPHAPCWVGTGDGLDWLCKPNVGQSRSRHGLARRSVVRNELGVRVRLLSHRDRVAVVAVALGGVDNARSRAARCGPARPAPSLLTEPSARPSTRHRRSGRLSHRHDLGRPTADGETDHDRGR